MTHSYVNVFAQFMGELQASISGTTIWHKPGNFFRFIGSVISVLLLLTDSIVIVLPFFIGRHYVTVTPSEVRFKEKSEVINK